MSTPEYLQHKRKRREARRARETVNPTAESMRLFQEEEARKRLGLRGKLTTIADFGNKHTQGLGVAIGGTGTVIGVKTAAEVGQTLNSGIYDHLFQIAQQFGIGATLIAIGAAFYTKNSYQVKHN
jgi:hypothetical protein